MFEVMGLSFSLSITLRVTDAERQTPLLVSHVSAYVPESASESDGSTIV